MSPDSSKIVPAKEKALTFSGSLDVTIPAHADYISDPVSFPADPLSDVAITFHIDVPPQEQTGHPGSRATSYVIHGNSISATELQGAKTIEHWYFIAGIDVPAPPEAGATVVFGDSITDGHGATTNGNDRWTDVLARRLQTQSGSNWLSVLNQGIGGNHLLSDGLGPNALSRMLDDVVGADFTHVKLAHSQGIPTFVLRNIEDFNLYQTRPIPDTHLDKVTEHAL